MERRERYDDKKDLNAKRFIDNIIIVYFYSGA